MVNKQPYEDLGSGSPPCLLWFYWWLWTTLSLQQFNIHLRDDILFLYTCMIYKASCIQLFVNWRFLKVKGAYKYPNWVSHHVFLENFQTGVGLFSIPKIKLQFFIFLAKRLQYKTKFIFIAVFFFKPIVWDRYSWEWTWKGFLTLTHPCQSAWPDRRSEGGKVACCQHYTRHWSTTLKNSLLPLVSNDCEQITATIPITILAHDASFKQWFASSYAHTWTYAHRVIWHKWKSQCSCQHHTLAFGLRERCACDLPGVFSLQISCCNHFQHKGGAFQSCGSCASSDWSLQQTFLHIPAVDKHAAYPSGETF